MKGILQLSVIPMRATPSDKAEMVNQVLFGETFDVLERTEKWCKIKLHHDHYEGWIDNKQYAWTKTKNKKEISVVSSLFEKIKKEDATLIIPMGAVTEHTKPVHRSLIKTALLFLHTPYLWGGRTFMGIDCSGFTQVVFKVHGIPLKRDACQQAAQGKKINFENSTTNDLAFFHNTEGRVIHVGIVIKEKDKTRIIHASGKVRMDILDEKGIYDEATHAYTHRLHSIKRMER
ncbi:MAG: C40 family peptidase [Sphingobacteriales bacterium]|nr:C40 family peptidase [Sphingobacteriales bacterium]